ncbi:MAG: pseudouridine synthase [Halodesulfovibrio sp.]
MSRNSDKPAGARKNYRDHDGDDRRARRDGDGQGDSRQSQQSRQPHQANRTDRSDHSDRSGRAQDGHSQSRRSDRSDSRPASADSRHDQTEKPRGQGADNRGRQWNDKGHDRGYDRGNDRGRQQQHQPPRTQEAAYVDPSEPVRLNKALALAGICSRRAADELIAQGAVGVNGQTVTTAGVKVVLNKDVVTVNGVTVNLNMSRQTFTYVMANKPVRVVTTVKDPQGRTTILDLLPPEMKKARLFPVGRLDFFSEGLILLTDDGDLTYRLTHPKWHLPKVYRVRIRGAVADSALRTMRSGMTLAEGEELAPVKVNVLREENGVTTLEMHLMQGINRQIRRMCRDLDLTILSLKRFRHGPLDLGNLDKGKARFLDENEVSLLRRATGLE